MKNIPLISNVYVIGCGGVGSWLVPTLVKLVSAQKLVLVDGDTLEERNLDRQFFNPSMVGRNKADALAELYGVRLVPKWFDRSGPEFQDISHGDWLFCCADNNRARNEVLSMCDVRLCNAIIAANETNSAEAYVYTNWMLGGFQDPRQYYPEIVSDLSNDPRAEGIGCTGYAQEQNPQLVSANFMAAALAQHLFVLWAEHAPDLDVDTQDKLPHKLVANLSQLETHRLEQAKRPVQQQQQNQVERTE